jgi:hypothetical protein
LTRSGRRCSTLRGTPPVLREISQEVWRSGRHAIENTRLLNELRENPCAGVSNSKVGIQSSTQTVAQSASVTTAYPKRVASPLVNWLNAAADDSAPIVIHTSIGALFVFG